MKILIGLFIILFCSNLTGQNQDTNRYVYLVVEERPKLQNEDVEQAVNLYLVRNISLSGSFNCFFTNLKIDFIVEPNGLLSSKHVLIPNNRFYCDSISHDAMDSIKQIYTQHIQELLDKFPKLTPGKINGEAVPVKIILPINIDWNSR